MARLGDAFEFIRNGANIKQGLDNYGYPITRIETISNKKIDRNKFGYAGITDISKYQDYVLKSGDILMSHINSEKHLGKAAIYEQQNGEIIIHGMNLLCLRPNAKIIFPKYAFYFLSSYGFLNQIPNITKKSVNQASFTVSALKELSFPFLDINKQKEIVHKLEKIDELISCRKEQLAKLDELVKTRFVEMFGHQSHNEKNMPYGKIDDVAEIYLGLTHTPTYVENGVKFISAKNTSCDYLDLSDVKYISRGEFEKAPKGTKPQIGDVLFSRVGSNLGHPVILDVDEELCTFVSLGFLRTKGAVTNVYLKHWMRDDFFAEQVAQKVVGGGQPNLNTGWLKEFKIIIPPMPLQNEFTAFVEQTEKTKSEVQKSLDELETLKKSLMQKYFG